MVSSTNGFPLHNTFTYNFPPGQLPADESRKTADQSSETDPSNQSPLPFSSPLPGSAFPDIQPKITTLPATDNLQFSLPDNQQYPQTYSFVQPSFNLNPGINWLLSENEPETPEILETEETADISQEEIQQLAEEFARKSDPEAQLDMLEEILNNFRNIDRQYTGSDYRDLLYSFYSSLAGVLTNSSEGQIQLHEALVMLTSLDDIEGSRDIYHIFFDAADDPGSNINLQEMYQTAKSKPEESNFRIDITEVFNAVNRIGLSHNPDGSKVSYNKEDGTQYTLQKNTDDSYLITIAHNDEILFEYTFFELAQLSGSSDSDLSADQLDLVEKMLTTSQEAEISSQERKTEPSDANSGIFNTSISLSLTLGNLYSSGATNITQFPNSPNSFSSFGVGPFPGSSLSPFFNYGLGYSNGFNNPALFPGSVLNPFFSPGLFLLGNPLLMMPLTINEQPSPEISNIFSKLTTDNTTDKSIFTSDLDQTIQHQQQLQESIQKLEILIKDIIADVRQVEQYSKMSIEQNKIDEQIIAKREENIKELTKEIEIVRLKLVEVQKTELKEIEADNSLNSIIQYVEQFINSLNNISDTELNNLPENNFIAVLKELEESKKMMLELFPELFKDS